MYGLIASNGTGKTTILNAITWCLYAQEYQLKDSDTALSIINAKKLKEMKVGETAVVSVKLTIDDNDKEIVFERKHKVMRAQSDDGVPISVLEPESEFGATESDLSTPDSTKSCSRERAEYLVAEYFENSIHDFFFFDGEKLEELFTAKKASSIQTSVEAMAQISLLDTVIRNSREISDAKSRKVAKGHPKVKKLEFERDKAYKEFEIDKKHRIDHEKQLEKRKKEKKKVDALLRENSISASLQSQKTLLKEKLDNIEIEQNEIRKRKVRLQSGSRWYASVLPHGNDDK